jgi:hypothetical protein
MLADAELAASRRRFGLFSQPPPLGLGDDSQYLSKQRTHDLMQSRRAKTASLRPVLPNCWQE